MAGVAKESGRAAAVVVALVVVVVLVLLVLSPRPPRVLLWRRGPARRVSIRRAAAGGARRSARRAADGDLRRSRKAGAVGIFACLLACLLVVDVSPLVGYSGWTGWRTDSSDVT